MLRKTEKRLEEHLHAQGWRDLDQDVRVLLAVVPPRVRPSHRHLGPLAYTKRGFLAIHLELDGSRKDAEPLLLVRVYVGGCGMPTWASEQITLDQLAIRVPSHASPNKAFPSDRVLQLVTSLRHESHLSSAKPSPNVPLSPNAKHYFCRHVLVSPWSTPCRYLADRGPHLLGDREPDRIVHATAAFGVLAGQPVQQPARGSGAVGADQQLLAMRRWTAGTWPIAAVAAVTQACDGQPFWPRPPESLVGEGEPEHRMIGRNPTQVAFFGIASTGAEDVQRLASGRHVQVVTKDARSILGWKLQGADRNDPTSVTQAGGSGCLPQVSRPVRAVVQRNEEVLGLDLEHLDRREPRDAGAPAGDLQDPRVVDVETEAFDADPEQPRLQPRECGVVHGRRR